MSHGQEDDGVVSLALPVRNSLTFNRYAINPTFSFVREQTKFISITNKREWVQFEDAPQTYLASYSGRFGENIGAGLALFQQNYGVLTTFGGILNFAYNAVLDRDSNLTFGLNIGAYKSGVNTSNVITNFEDPSLQNVPSNFLLNISPGINYGTEFLDFGLSVNNLALYNLESSSLIEDNPEQGIQAHLMYTGYMDSRGFFDESKFSGLVKSEFKQDETIIAGLIMVTVPKGIWAQVGYNTVYGASGGIGLNITKQIAIEYNFEKAIGDLSDFGPSHEVSLAYRFTNNKNYDYSREDDVSGLFSNDGRKRYVSRNKRSKTSSTKKVVDNVPAKAKLAEEEKARKETKSQAELAAKEQVKAEAKAMLEVEKQAKIVAEEKAKLEAKKEAEAQAKLEAERIAKAKEEARAKIAAQQKAKEDAEEKVKAEAKLLAEQKAKEEAKERAIADAEAKKLAEQEAKIALQEQQRLAAEQKAKKEAEEKAKLLAEQNAKREAEEKVIAEQKARFEAERIAQQEAEEKTQAKLVEENNKEQLISNPTTEIGKSIYALTQDTEDAKETQNDLLKALDEAVAAKNQNLKDLKEENDLSEQGIAVAPKPFKSITAENNALRAIQLDLDNNIKIQNDQISELNKLYDEIREGTEITNEEVLLFYKKKIDRLTSEQAKALKAKTDLEVKLETIKKAIEFERRRRIKRAKYDNEEDRYAQDRSALNSLKQNTPLAQTPYKEDDFDFGEELSDNISILKNVPKVEEGYYLILAVHNDSQKRDEFLKKVIASGRTDVDFFYDVKTSKYYIYYQKTNSISSANETLKTKGNRPYKGKMSIVKIEN